MKTKIVTLVSCMFIFIIYGNAQWKSDYFFYSDNGLRATDPTPFPYKTGKEIAFQSMVTDAAPIGNGLIVLIVFVLIYLLLKRKEFAK